MPIFISYSQQDKDFVDNLARNLVATKYNVWMDRWELSLDHSITQKIEGALTRAKAEFSRIELVQKGAICRIDPKALRAAGAEKVYRETASGARHVLDKLEKGDVLMVTRLGRLARSTRDLLNTLAAITGKGAGFRST